MTRGGESVGEELTVTSAWPISQHLLCLKSLTAHIHPQEMDAVVLVVKDRLTHLADVVGEGTGVSASTIEAFSGSM